MPIYEYRCENCGHQLEALQKISDPLLKTCPDCGQDSLRKRVSAAAFRLKGGGWYETDFKDKKTRKNTSGDEASTAGGGDNNKESATENKEGKSKTGSEKPAAGGTGNKTASG